VSERSPRSITRWRSLAKDGPTDKELEESKQYLVGSLPRTLETNASIAGFLQSWSSSASASIYDVRCRPDPVGIARPVHAARAASSIPHVPWCRRRPVCRTGGMIDVREGSATRLEAIFFDVDFTLIYPGPTFQGEGYEQFARDHGMAVERSRFSVR
jgi:hypothetical protein